MEQYRGKAVFDSLMHARSHVFPPGGCGRGLPCSHPVMSRRQHDWRGYSAVPRARPGALSTLQTCIPQLVRSAGDVLLTGCAAVRASCDRDDGSAAPFRKWSEFNGPKWYSWCFLFVSNLNTATSNGARSSPFIHQGAFHAVPSIDRKRCCSPSLHASIFSGTGWHSSSVHESLPRSGSADAATR